MSYRRSGLSPDPIFIICLAVLSFASVLIGPTPNAGAQDFDLQQFHPMPDQSRNFFGASSAEVAPHLYWQASTLAHYAHNPLVLRDRDGNRQHSLVGSQSSVNLLASMGLFERVELGLDVPMVATRAEENFPTLDPSERGGFGLGDIRFVPKVQVFNTRESPYERGFALAIVGDLFIPVGQSQSFHGGELRGGLRLAGDTVLAAGVRLAANLGYMMRPETQFVTLEVGDMVSWALAGEVPLGADFRILGEVAGKVSVTASELRPAHVPVEAIFGTKFERGGFFAQAGAGLGIVYGFGTPDFRALLGVGYALSQPAAEHVVPQPIAEVEPEPVVVEAPEPEPEPAAIVEPEPEPEEEPEPEAVIDEEQGQIVINQMIHFDLNSARVLPRSFPILDKVAQILDADPSMRVRIEGHGDWRGGHYINLYLSERRARYVRIYLMEKGIAPERLQMKGMGRDHPIADNETEEGMAKNRRVEFHILKD